MSSDLDSADWASAKKPKKMASGGRQSSVKAKHGGLSSPVGPPTSFKGAESYQTRPSTCPFRCRCQTPGFPVAM